MFFPRSSGVLLHITSLPGQYGIGDLGPEAFKFADFLADTYQHLWQILPLGPTGYGNSPYACLSVFAGNPLLISIDKVIGSGLLTKEDIKQKPVFPENRVDFERVVSFKIPLLKKSFEIFDKHASETDRKNFDLFCQQNTQWLDDFALFVTLKEAHNNICWRYWKEDLKKRKPETIAQWKEKLAYQIKCQKFIQYLFFQQWNELKKYCNSLNIKFIGDMPIFVDFDSDTVWSHPELFLLDKNYCPTVVAGVPPDYFSSTGQLWGNPLYNWDIMDEQKYLWWIERFHSMLTTVDFIRIDHFRGFESYWEIPYGETTAVNGKWRKGPGIKFFHILKEKLGDIPVIAEDLGMITEDVKKLRDELGLPGMRVLQFAFGDDSKQNEHKPFNYPRNCVVYTGTHDNDTTLGWFKGNNNATTLTIEARAQEKMRVLKYTGTDGHKINWDFIRLAFSSVADLAVVPLQDILGLDSNARMNTPGRTQGNWEWRFSADQITEKIKKGLKEFTIIFGRKL